MTQTTDNLLRHNGYTGSVEFSLEDNALHGRLLHIDDLITYGGETVAELKAEFIAAVEDYLAYCKEVGKTPNKPYTGSFNVRIGHDRHRWLAEVAASAGVTLNDALCRTIDRVRVRAPGGAAVPYRPIVVASSNAEIARPLSSGAGQNAPFTGTTATASVTH